MRRSTGFSAIIGFQSCRRSAVRCLVFAVLFFAFSPKPIFGQSLLSGEIDGIGVPQQTYPYDQMYELIGPPPGAFTGYKASSNGPISYSLNCFTAPAEVLPNGGTLVLPGDSLRFDGTFAATLAASAANGKLSGELVMIGSVLGVGPGPMTGSGSPFNGSLSLTYTDHYHLVGIGPLPFDTLQWKAQFDGGISTSGDGLAGYQFTVGADVKTVPLGPINGTIGFQETYNGSAASGSLTLGMCLWGKCAQGGASDMFSHTGQWISATFPDGSTPEEHGFQIVFDSGNPSPNAGGSPVPEPSTLIVWSLLGSLAIGLGWWRKRKTA